MMNRIVSTNFLFGLVILAIAAFVSRQFVLFQFGGYDLSPLIDLQWRLYNNETPGVDFVNTMPLGILALVKAVGWGLLRWHDLTDINICLSLFVYIFLWTGFNNKSESRLWCGSIALIISGPLLYTNHLWHSSMSQYFAMIYFMALYYALDDCKIGFKKIFYLTAASALIVLAKQNIALPSLIISFVYYACVGNKNKSLILASILSGVFLGLFLTIYLLDMPLDSFVYTYKAVLGRGKLDSAMWDATKGIRTNWMCLLIIAVFALLFYSVRNGIGVKERLLIYAFLLISIVPVLTDWDVKINNLPLPLFVLYTGVYFGSKSENRQNLLNFSVCVLVSLALITGGGGYRRERMSLVGPFYEKLSNQVETSGYFQGLRSGPLFHGVLSEINDVRNRWPKKAVYFGPRIEFAYSYTNTKSPPGLPLWVHPGTSYALGDERAIVNAFIKSEFYLIVFAKNDRTRIPSEILNYVENNYIRVNWYKFLDVYVTNKHDYQVGLEQPVSGSERNSITRNTYSID